MVKPCLQISHIIGDFGLFCAKLPQDALSFSCCPFLRHFWLEKKFILIII